MALFDPRCVEGPAITNTIRRSFCDFRTLDGKSTQVYID